MVWSPATRLVEKAEDGILHHGVETLSSHSTCKPCCCPCQLLLPPGFAACGGTALVTAACRHDRSHNCGDVNHGLTPGLHRLPALCEGLALSSRTVTPATDLRPSWERGCDTPDTSSPSQLFPCRSAPSPGIAQVRRQRGWTRSCSKACYHVPAALSCARGRSCTRP